MADLKEMLMLVDELENFSVEKLDSTGAMFRVVVHDCDGLPIVVRPDASQLLCKAYLFAEDQVLPEKRAEMMEKMLELNVPMPLSAFGKFQGYFGLFGALPASSEFETIVQEIQSLADNAVSASQQFQGFLVQP